MILNEPYWFLMIICCELTVFCSIQAFVATFYRVRRITWSPPVLQLITWSFALGERWPSRQLEVKSKLTRWLSVCVSRRNKCKLFMVYIRQHFLPDHDFWVRLKNTNENLPVTNLQLSKDFCSSCYILLLRYLGTPTLSDITTLSPSGTVSNTWPYYNLQ